ncbi:DUF6705 family protein [Flavobacterium sp.]|uniref:DUF6705 family protein n=1 Tax=Flavobacterium sp. TaxID=239 RepID=UPI0037536492
MKKINIFILLILVVTCKAQTIVNINTYNNGNNYGKYFKDIDNNFQSFIGTWESINGNITFRVVLSKDEQMPMGSPVKYYMDRIGGSFQIIENANMPNEIIIHDSIKYYSISNTTTNSVIYAASYGSNTLGGHMENNCANNGDDFITGFLKMNIINPTSLPLQVQWNIKTRPLQAQETFNIPINVILTKVD